MKLKGNMMKKDIYVELLKVFKRKSFIVFLLLIIFITVLLTLFNKSEISDEIEYLDKLTKEQYPYDDYDNYLKRYGEYEKINSNEILKKEYILNNDINIDEKVKSDLYVSKTIVLFLSIYIIVLSCRSFGYEYDIGTIKLLMLYKNERRKIVLSKFISLVIISCLISNLVFFCNALTTIFVHGNIFKFVELIPIYGNIMEKPLLIVHTCEYLMLLIPQILLISISLLMGLLFKSSTISSSITIFIYLCSSLITDLFLQMKIRIIEFSFLPYVDYTIFTNKTSLILYNIENGININVNTGLIIIVIYSLFMLILTISIFKKRELR